MACLEGNQSLFEANMDDILEDVRFLFEDTTAELDTDLNVLEDLASIDIQDKICKMADIEANMDNILEDVRFIFEDTTAEQDTDLHILEDSASTDIYTKILKMTDETLEADVDKYLEDIRFLFDGEDTTVELDTSSLEDNEIGAGNVEGVKQEETFRQKVKRLKKGVRRFFSRFLEDVRRSFCCCVSVEME